MTAGAMKNRAERGLHGADTRRYFSFFVPEPSPRTAGYGLSPIRPVLMRAQIRQVCENVRAALLAAGADVADLVKTTTYVTDIDEFFKHVDVRMEYFGAALPTSTTVEVRRLSHPDFLVEVEAIAVIAAA
jgi:enamine deaminase RidA (YjgF/YER057c/UK114 family)